MAHVNMLSTRIPVAKPLDPCSEGIGPATLASSRVSASKRPERPEPKVSLGSKLPHPSKKSCNCLLMCPIRATCSLLVGRLKAARSTGFPLTATKLEVAMTKSTYRSSSYSLFSGSGKQGNSPRCGGGSSLDPRVFAAVQIHGLHAGGFPTEPAEYARRVSQPRR